MDSTIRLTAAEGRHMAYRYFVGYAYMGIGGVAGFGVGNAAILTRRAIRSMEDTGALVEALKADRVVDPVILSFQLLEGPLSSGEVDVIGGEAAAPATVHVLTWTSKHGSTVTVHATGDLALREAARIVGEELDDVIEVGGDYAGTRAGSVHEEDVVGGRARCEICGWVDEADPDDEEVMEYHGDSFPEREPSEMIRKALAAGDLEAVVSLYNEHNVGGDDIRIEEQPVLTGPVPGQ